MSGRYKEPHQTVNASGVGLVVALVDKSMYLPEKPQPFTQILDHATFEFIILLPYPSSLLMLHVWHI